MTKKQVKSEVPDEPVSDKAPDAKAVKIRLDTLIAERDQLIKDRADLQADLVKVWGSDPEVVNEAVTTIAHNENKITSLGTVIEHVTDEYRQALGAAALEEYDDLKTDLVSLKDERQLLTADLAAAQQAYEASRYAVEKAESEWAGMLSQATSTVEPAVHQAAEITDRYSRAVEAHEAVEKAATDRQNACNTLRDLELKYITLYHEISLKERRAHELGSLTGSPYDVGVAYRP